MQSSSPPITATGVRGFMQWLRREQPGIYRRAAPQIQHLVPRAFGRLGSYRGARMIVTSSLRRARGLQGLGDTADDLQPIDVTASTEIAPDLADSGSTGTTDNTTSNLISSIVNGITSIYTTKAQADTLSQLTSAQIAQAQAGRPPLNISTGAYGIPTISTGVTSSSLLLWGGLGLGVLVLAMAAGRSR